MAAWRVGRFPIRFAEVLVTQDIGVRRVPITSASIVVASVLPADSAEWAPKPPRAIFTFGLPWWVWLLVALAIAAVVALLWWLWRRRRRRPLAREAPYAIAAREFERVEALGLVAAGARDVSLMVEICGYLAAVMPVATTSLTSSSSWSCCAASA